MLSCVVVEHDLWLVGLAALFCLTASLTAFRLYARSVQGRLVGRLPWVVLTGLAAGSGIWATHFIAMLAYQPSARVGYEPMGTALSLLIAVVMTAGAFSVSSPTSTIRKVAAGVVFGAGVALMHYCGMAAFRPQGLLMWDAPAVAASLVLGSILAAAAMLACGDARNWRRRVAAAGILTLSICSLHFIGMSAVTILPDPTVVVSASGFTRNQLATAIGALTGITLLGAIMLLLVDVYNRRTSMQHMRLLFDANPAPMWLVEPVSLRFLSVNDAAVRVYGYPRDRLPDMTVFDIIHPDEREALRAYANGDSIVYEGDRVWRHVRADGSELLVQPYAQPVPHGHGTAVLCALFDVTDRERAAEALVHARDQAEAANRAKGQFLANMSHEIRTPLNGVIGVLSALERTRLDAEQQEMISIIGASASTLQRLLDDVLDSSRIESGGLTIESRPFDLHSAVHTLAELFAPNARQKGVAFSVDVDAAVPAWAEGDQQRVRQVLGNLLSNAVKFTDVGSVALTVDAPEPGAVRFTVADTGVGFDAEFHARLFERFEQADASVTRRFGGSGLGLSIARDLVERMGGALTAQSVPGAGSTFVLCLPLSETASPMQAPVAAVGEPDDASTERPLRVLLADDHPINRRVVELMLSTVDVELTAVEDGALALEAFEIQAFDLVLMDLQMPVMDGLEAIRRIRGREASRNLAPTPIYVLSANAMDEHVAAARAAGATAHLSKPIAAAALLAVIQAVDESLRLAA